MTHAARRYPRLFVRTTTALLPLALLLTGCSSNESTGPAPEVTEASDPATETGEPEDEETAQAAVAVELPGLPIGGPPPAFQAPGDADCAVINLSGTPLPDGVVAVIEGFVPIDGFAFGAGSCGGVPACLEGQGITPEGGTCSLPVAYDVDPASGGAALDIPVEVPLQVAAATLLCPDQPTCDLAQQAVVESGLETVELEVFWDPTAPAETTEESTETPLDDTGDGADEGDG